MFMFNGIYKKKESKNEGNTALYELFMDEWINKVLIKTSNCDFIWNFYLNSVG